jgi:hypothetical protein
MQEPAGLDIRYTYVTDTSYLRQWLENPDVQKWFPVSEEKEITDCVQCWIGFSRYSSSITATLNGVPCGIATLFLMPYRKVAHHCLFKLIVDPKFQRHLAKNYFRLELMHIEVFEGNPFIHLLQEQGFKEFCRQEKFVKDSTGYHTRVLFESYL